MSDHAVIAEGPFFVQASTGPVFGVVTTPPEPRGAVVLCPGGWQAGNTNSNRLLVRMAHELAGFGLSSVRFDWEGTGESPGSRQSFVLDNPAPGDVLAASRMVEKPQALVGLCFGARSALSAAPDLPDLKSLVLLSFPLPAARVKVQRAERVGTLAALREGLRPAAIKGWFDPATRRVYRKFISLRWQKLRASAGLGSNAKVQEAVARKARKQVLDVEALVGQLEHLAEHGVKVLFLFGTTDALYDEFVSARSGPLGSLIDKYPRLMEIAVIEGDLIGFSTLEVQDNVIDQVVSWLGSPVADQDIAG